MYQKDYILRLIEQLFRFLSEVLTLIKKGEYTKASGMITESYNDYLREDASFFRKIPREDLTCKLLAEHNYTNDHLEILAELFNAEAELQIAMGKSKESLEYSQKALLLFEFIDKELRTYSHERLNKIKIIKNRISEIISEP